MTNTKQKVYKYNTHNYYRMFPSDPAGSLDDFLLINYLILRGKI